MSERSHLSIGEVLALLREEFPDVTISKIRFLESQGLVDPERTPSGYRKFYDNDVERLRWILRQQRENFLPLKVIRGRLTEHGEESDNGAEEAMLEPSMASVESRSGDGASQGGGSPAGSSSGPEGAVTGPGPVGAGAGESHAGSSHPSASTRRRAAGEAAKATHAPSAESGGAARRPAGTGGRLGRSVQPELGEDPGSFTVEELAAATGASDQLVRDLQQFGLISTHAIVAGTPYFDAGALDVVRAAAGFARHGVEARHLRAWRNAADREAGLFEQIIMPLLRQRNPEARRQAAATVAELSALGADLRKALIDQAIRQIH